MKKTTTEALAEALRAILTDCNLTTTGHGGRMDKAIEAARAALQDYERPIPDHTAAAVFEPDQAKAAFSAAWERAQNASGHILRAYYYGTRPEYVAAVDATAEAFAALEKQASPKH